MLRSRSRALSPTLPNISVTGADEPVEPDQFCSEKAIEEMSVLGSTFEEECRLYLEKHPAPRLPLPTDRDPLPYNEENEQQQKQRRAESAQPRPAQRTTPAQTPTQPVAAEQQQQQQQQQHDASQPAPTIRSHPEPMDLVPTVPPPDAPGVRFSSLSAAEHVEFIQLHQQYLHDVRCPDDPQQLTPETQKRYVVAATHLHIIILSQIFGIEAASDSRAAGMEVCCDAV